MAAHRVVRLPTLAALALLATCTDQPLPTDPTLPPDAAASRPKVIACQVEVAARELSCQGPQGNPAPGLSLSVTLGGQDTLVKLASSNVSYDDVSEIFQADVTVQNLIGQALGTTDGTTLNPEGVRVFFHSGPTVTEPQGTGPVTVANADGTGTFTGSNQPYFQYDAILATGVTSVAKTWEWNVPPTVNTFVFEVAVQAEVQHPNGWVEVSPGTAVIGTTETVSLNSTVRDVIGHALTGVDVTWSSASESIATVEAASGQVTGMSHGLAVITASSAGPQTPGQATISVAATDTIGPAGGTVTFSNEVTVTIPAGALTGEAGVTVAEVAVPPEVPADADFAGTGGVYDVSVSGATIQDTIEITMAFDPSVLSQDGVVPEDLAATYWDGAAWVTVPATVDTVAGTMTVKTVPAMASPVAGTTTVIVAYLFRLRKIRFHFFNADITQLRYSIQWKRGHTEHSPPESYPGGSGAYARDIADALELTIYRLTQMGFDLPDKVRVYIADAQDAPTFWDVEYWLYGEWFPYDDAFRGLNFSHTDGSIWLDNDLCEYRSVDRDCTAPQVGQWSSIDTKELIPLLTAHEYFHQAQFQYGGYVDSVDRVQNGWLRESTARWFENVLFPSLTDDLGNELSWYELADSASKVWLVSGLRYEESRYRRFPFFQYLQGRFGESIVREVFEAFSSTHQSETPANAGLAAVAQAVEGHGSTFGVEWQGFADQYLFLHSDVFGEYSGWTGFVEPESGFAEWDMDFRPNTPLSSGSVTLSTATPEINLIIPIIFKVGAEAYEIQVDADIGSLELEFTQAAGPSNALQASVFLLNHQGAVVGTSTGIAFPATRSFAGVGTTFDRAVLVISNSDYGSAATATLVARLVPIANQPPTVAITSPGDMATFDEGEPVSFDGSADDPEDGPLTGSALVWTSSLDGQLGTGGSFQRDDLSPGWHIIVLTATDSDGAQGTDSVQIRILSSATWTSIAAGAAHTCGIGSDGSAYCWGANWSGELGGGRGSVYEQWSPDSVIGGLRFVSITAGYRHTCGLTTTGVAYCWGSNSAGQLGSDSTTTECAEPCVPWPVPVSGGLTFESLAAGSNHTCGRTGSGLMYCWGANRWGQLGDGTTTSRSAPALVSDPSTFAYISAGGSNTCGITPAGEAYCWGDNHDGQLGIGSGDVVTHPTPAAVLGDHEFSSICSSSGVTCALTPTGSAYCWGSNMFGELGSDSTTTECDTPSTPCVPWPVAVSGGLTFESLANSWSHVCARTDAGVVRCWGRNADGQLGDGTTIDRHAPTPVSGSVTFVTVDAGGHHTCGVATDGEAYCWGRNWSGQLGDGTQESKYMPERVRP